MLSMEDFNTDSGFTDWPTLDITGLGKMHLPPSGIAVYDTDRLAALLSPWEEPGGLFLLLPDGSKLPPGMNRWVMTVSFLNIGPVSGENLKVAERYEAWQEIVEGWNIHFKEQNYEKTYKVVPVNENKQSRVNVTVFKDGKPNTNGMLGSLQFVVTDPVLGACQNAFNVLYTVKGILVFRFLSQPLQYLDSWQLFVKLVDGVRFDDGISLPYKSISPELAEQARKRGQPTASDVLKTLKPIFLKT